MSKHLNKSLDNASYREKVGFTSGLGKTLAATAAKNPFWTMAGIGTAGGAAAVLGNRALGVTSQPMDTGSYLINKQLNPGVGGVLNRVRADELIAQNITKNVGDIANSFINETLSDMSKGYKKIVNKPKQQALLKDLMETDEMLREADPEHVASLFNTMVDVAPKMTKYKDAVKSFLRQGVAHEGGLDPVTLGELAKAEARLSGKGYET
jgi:hypothetical protein